MTKNQKNNDNIKDWYLAAYPSDDIACEQIFDQTFSKLTDLLKNSLQDAVEYVGECDTQVRERIIAEAQARMAR